MSQTRENLGPDIAWVTFFQPPYRPETSDEAKLTRAAARLPSGAQRGEGFAGFTPAVWDFVAANAQPTVLLSARPIGATGNMTLKDPLVEESIHLISGQCGWTL